MRRFSGVPYVLPGLLLCLTLTACGGGGGESGAPANESIGGVWTGKDSDNNDLVVLVTEAGAFRFLDVTSGFQGFGAATVTNGSSVTLNYTQVAPYGDTFSDGGVSATCSATGTLREGESLTVNISCRSNANSTWTEQASLAYDSTYDRDSSLAAIAGLYDDDGEVMSIDRNGKLFEQNAATGCVLNGQVSIIDSAWNAYGIAFSIGNCQGLYAPLNGSSWDGIATLESAGTTETLVAGVTGNVQGVTASIVVALPKM